MKHMNEEITWEDALLQLEQVKDRRLPPKDIPTLANPLYARAYTKFLHHGTLTNTLREGSDNEGGYLVPDEFESRIVLAMKEKNVMPCGSTRNEVAILYGDFSQVEVLQQGTDPMQEHECITFPGTVEVSMDGYAQVRLLDIQAVKGLRVKGKEAAACKKSPSA